MIGHGCGIYALSTIDKVVLEMGFHKDLIFGKVLLGGKVWPHEGGYRAEKAQIAGLYGEGSFGDYQKYLEYRPPYTPSWVHEISKAYDVPVIGVAKEEREQLLFALEAHWIETRLGLPI